MSVGTLRKAEGTLKLSIIWCFEERDEEESGCVSLTRNDDVVKRINDEDEK